MAYIIFVFLLIIALIISLKEKGITTIIQQPPIEYNMEAVRYATYQKALSGDKSARDWVLKNIFEKEENVQKLKINHNAKQSNLHTQPIKTQEKVVVEKPTLKSEQVPQISPLERARLVEDCVLGLKSLGVKKSQARLKVNQLINMGFKTEQDIIREYFKKC